jgi:N-methylhydantoinase A/oxoprolinase/acetone carboxylase beta subunit
VLTFALSLAAPAQTTDAVPAAGTDASPRATGTRALFDVEAADYTPAAIYRRSDVQRGAIHGPAVVVEDQITTVVPRGFQVHAGTDGALILRRAL